MIVILHVNFLELGHVHISSIPTLVMHGVAIFWLIAHDLKVAAAAGHGGRGQVRAREHPAIRAHTAVVYLCCVTTSTYRLLVLGESYMAPQPRRTQ